MLRRRHWCYECSIQLILALLTVLVCGGLAWMILWS